MVHHYTIYIIYIITINYTQQLLLSGCIYSMPWRLLLVKHVDAHKRHLLPKVVVTDVVEALVIPHVLYCLTVIFPMEEVQKRRLERILNFAARLLSGRRKFELG